MDFELIFSSVSLLFFAILFVRIVINVRKILGAQKEGEKRTRDLVLNILGAFFVIFLFVRELIELIN